MTSQNDASDEIFNQSHMQEHLLSFLPIAPTVFSVAASSTILYLVIRSGFTSAYKRILFGLSVSDIITSITFALQPFLIPRETSHRLWAIGNDATCTALGAFTQLLLSTIMYNGMLSVYYLLTIRFGVRESAFARRYEPWMHAVAIVYPVITSIVGVSLNAYHEVDIGHGCWVAGYPEGCSEDEGECRGDLMGWLFMGLWTVSILILIVVINFVIFCHVRRLLVRGRRRSFNTMHQTKRINEVAIQCFMYIAAFLGTFIWAMILKVMDSRNFDSSNEGKLFPLRVLNALLLPSTGFFNLCIYLRPRYVTTRSEFPAESRLWAVRRALYGEAIPPTPASADFVPSKQPQESKSGSDLCLESLDLCTEESSGPVMMPNPSPPPESHPDARTDNTSSKSHHIEP